MFEAKQEFAIFFNKAAETCENGYNIIKFYMGSSSMLVWIGSDSRCNSFVVNQFLFFTPNGENFLCYTPKKEWQQRCGKKMFCLFFISKRYIPMSRKNGGQKREWQYPTACVGSHFIPDQNIQTYLFVCKVATCKSTRKLISGLPSMSVYNNDGWKWA